MKKVWLHIDFYKNSRTQTYYEHGHLYFSTKEKLEEKTKDWRDTGPYVDVEIEVPDEFDDLDYVPDSY